MAHKRRPNSYALFLPLDASTVETYQRQRERLEVLMGPDLARYFVWVDPNPGQLPDAVEHLNPVHEARELYNFMQRNQLTLNEMRNWILTTQEEERVIEIWCSGDSSLLNLASTMLDLRRQTWGEFLLLLEKKGHQKHASRQLHNDGQQCEHHSAVRGGGLPAVL